MQTIELLQYQYIPNYMEHRQLNEIIKECKKDKDIFFLITNVYNLGKINGVRQERSRRK